MLQPVTRPLIRPICQSITGALGGGFSPVSLFSGTDKGYIYDNNDLTSFYLDSAGTTAATVNGLVGLQLDKSANLALGSEQRQSFAPVLLGSATPATYNTSTGEGFVTRVDSGNQSGVGISGLSSSGWFLLDITNTGANDLGIRNGSGGVGGFVWYTLAVGQRFIGYVFALDGYITISPRPSGASSTTFTINSLKLISGNHRYQTTTGSKPILRGTPVGSNLVTNGDFASGTGWFLNGAVSVSGGKGNYTAATTGNNLQWTGNGGVSGLVIGRVYRVQFTIDSISAGSLRSYAGAAGVTRSAAGTYVDYITAGTTDLYIGVVGGVATTAVIDNIIVHDVSADAVTAPYGLQYDGIDDFLTTASVDFTATDKMAVVMGVRKLSDANQSILVELTATSVTNPGFAILAPGSAGVGNYSFRSTGTVTSLTSRATYSAPVSNVVTGIGDISGDSVRLDIDGVDGTPVTTDQGTGNYSNAILYFGRRGGTTLPYNGLDFGGICVNKTLTASQLSSAERWTASRTGVTL